MGKEAVEVGFLEGSEIRRVAAAAGSARLAGGRADGSVWMAELTGQGVRTLVDASGSPVSALAMSADATRIAYGDEAGNAGVLEV